MTVIDITSRRADERVGELIEEFAELRLCISTFNALKVTPPEITFIGAETRQRLANPLVYKVLDFSYDLQEYIWEEQVGSKPEIEALKVLKRSYPILGNTIQVLFEFINERIDQDELAGYFEDLKTKFDKFYNENKDIWLEMLDNVFYCPSSVNNGDPFLTMELLCDYGLILGKYGFLKKAEFKYSLTNAVGMD